MALAPGHPGDLSLLPPSHPGLLSLLPPRGPILAPTLPPWGSVPVPTLGTCPCSHPGLLSLVSPCHPGMSLCPHRASAKPAFMSPRGGDTKPAQCQARPPAPPAGLPRSRSTPGLAGSSPFKAAGSHFSASLSPSPAQSLPPDLAHTPGVLLQIKFIEEDPSQVEFLGASSTAQGTSPLRNTPKSPRRTCPQYVPTCPEPGQDP